MSTAITAGSLPARDIKRRGISAVDAALKNGPVHIIKDDRPTYVVMGEERYAELLEAERELAVARIREAEVEYRAGKAKPMSAAEIIASLDAEAGDRV
jgi:hypothetical protein